MNPEPNEVKDALPNGGRPWLMILVGEKGELQVKGTISDKMLAYGLIAAAQDAIRDHIKDLSKPSVSGGMLDFVRGGRRKR